jgi:hypothetical protein
MFEVFFRKKQRLLKQKKKGREKRPTTLILVFATKPCKKNN